MHRICICFQPQSVTTLFWFGHCFILPTLNYYIITWMRVNRCKTSTICVTLEHSSGLIQLQCDLNVSELQLWNCIVDDEYGKNARRTYFFISSEDVLVRNSLTLSSYGMLIYSGWKSDALLISSLLVWQRCRVGCYSPVVIIQIGTEVTHFLYKVLLTEKKL